MESCLLISIAMAYLKMQSKLLSDASLDKRMDLGMRVKERR